MSYGKENIDYSVNKLGTKNLLSYTNSYRIFLEESNNLEFMLMFILYAEHKNKSEIKNDLIEIYEEEYPDKISQNLTSFFKSSESDAIFNPHNYELQFGQMAFCRLVDNTLCYFKDILSEVVIKEPRILKTSKEKENYDFILSFDSLNDLIKALSDKKIKKLFYGGIEDIKNFFSDYLGIKLFDEKKDENDFSMVIKQRNLIVHNRGKITKEFAKDFPIYKNMIGKSFLFEFNQLSEINQFIK